MGRPTDINQSPLTNEPPVPEPGPVEREMPRMPVRPGPGVVARPRRGGNPVAPPPRPLVGGHPSRASGPAVRTVGEKATPH
jgi:hypothetical protein